MFMQIVEKAGINGLITGAGTAMYFGSGSVVRGVFGSRSMPLFVLTGIAGAIGSMVGDGIHTTLNEAIPVSKKANDRMSVITGAGINGGALALLLYLYQPNILRDFGLFTAIAFGAGTEIAGSALYTYLKENGYF